MIENFSHAGASGGQFILDIEAQVFFSVNAKNQLAWSPVAGISMPTGFCPINVSAIFSGFVIPTVCNEPEQAADMHPTGKGIGVSTFSVIPPNNRANHSSPLLIPQFWHSGKIVALKHRRHYCYPPCYAPQKWVDRLLASTPKLLEFCSVFERQEPSQKPRLLNFVAGQFVDQVAPRPFRYRPWYVRSSCR